MATLDFRGFSESSAIADFINYGAIVPLANCTPARLFIGANGTFGDNFLALQTDQYNGVTAQIGWPVATLNIFFGIRMTLKLQGNQNPKAAVTFALTDATSNKQVTVSINSLDGSIRVFTGTTQIASAGPGTFIPGLTRYLEIGAGISSIGGSVVVRLDGNVVINVANVSTVSNGAAPAITTVVFGNDPGYDGNPTAPAALILQHMYVNDNTGPAPLNGFLGDVRVTGQLYAASSGVPAFAPSGAATNVAVCATNPPVPATIRNVSTTVGDTDTYTIQPAPPSTTTVFAVGMRTLASKDAAGNRSLQNKLTSGTATASGVSVSLGIAPVYVRDNFGTDPGTAGPWTVAAVNALKPSYTGG